MVELTFLFDRKSKLRQRKVLLTIERQKDGPGDLDKIITTMVIRPLDDST